MPFCGLLLQMRVFQCRKEKCCTSDGSVITCAAAVGGVSFQNDMRCQALRCLTLRKFSNSKIDVPLLYRIIRHLSTPLHALFCSDIHPVFRYMHHLRVLQDVKTIKTAWKSYILQKANVINPHGCSFLFRTELRLFIFEIQNDSAFLCPARRAISASRQNTLSSRRSAEYKRGRPDFKSRQPLFSGVPAHDEYVRHIQPR